MTVAVCVCTGSRPAHLAACIASIESDDLVDEVVVSSDGIDRETDEVALDAQARSARRFVYTRGPRIGPAANRNACVAAVTADHVLFLDDDTRLHPAFLPTVVPLLDPSVLVSTRDATVFPTHVLRANAFDELNAAPVDETDLARRAVGDGLTARHLDAVPALCTAGRDAPAAPAGPVAVRPIRPIPAPRPRRDGEPVPGVSVVVPTYGRPDTLAACLDGLCRLSIDPDEVIVVRHRGDAGAAAVLARRRDSIDEVVLDERGQVVQLVAGTRRARSPVVAMIDDDAVPRHDWLEWLLAPYADPAVGGVGGRDVVHEPDGAVLDGSATRVGVLSRCGRVTGAHHLGVGRARDVQILKGVNCSYRRELVRFPVGLRGAGAPVGNDLATSLMVGSAGHRLVYEPRALVDHFPGPRVDGDDRTAPSARHVLDRAYNETYAIASVHPELLRRRVAYMLAVGTRASPGAARTMAAYLRRERRVTGRFRATAAATLRAATDARTRPLRFVGPVQVAQTVDAAGRSVTR